MTYVCVCLAQIRNHSDILGGCPLSGKSSMCMMYLNPWVHLLTYNCSVNIASVAKCQSKDKRKKRSHKGGG